MGVKGLWKAVRERTDDTPRDSQWVAQRVRDQNLHILVDVYGTFFSTIVKHYANKGGQSNDAVALAVLDEIEQQLKDWGLWDMVRNDEFSPHIIYSLLTSTFPFL
jgi:hypothetical protein